MSRIALSIALPIMVGLATAQTGAIARIAAPAAIPSSGVQLAHGTTGHRERDYEGLPAAKVSLVEALEIAEGEGPGRAIMAEFEGGIGKPCYEVKLLSDDGKLTHHRVDANSGQVTKSDDHPIESYFTSLKPSNLRDVDLSLRQAAVIAAKTGDKVAEAQIEREDDGVQYKITVVTNGEGHEVKVGSDGRIIPSR